MLFICGYHIRNHIHHKKANNSARTPTSSKTIVKMSNQKSRSVGSETVNDVSIKNDVISCCYFFADGLNCSRGRKRGTRQVRNFERRNSKVAEYARP